MAVGTVRHEILAVQPQIMDYVGAEVSGCPCPNSGGHADKQGREEKGKACQERSAWRAPGPKPPNDIRVIKDIDLEGEPNLN
jgi:hypothetical protein